MEWTPNKDVLWKGQDRFRAAGKQGEGKGEGEAIDPRSHSGGFGVSRCQVSAFGPA